MFLLCSMCTAACYYIQYSFLSANFHRCLLFKVHLYRLHIHTKSTINKICTVFFFMIKIIFEFQWQWRWHIWAWTASKSSMSFRAEKVLFKFWLSQKSNWLASNIVEGWQYDHKNNKNKDTLKCVELPSPSSLDFARELLTCIEMRRGRVCSALDHDVESYELEITGSPPTGLVTGKLSVHTAVMGTRWNIES